MQRAATKWNFHLFFGLFGKVVDLWFLGKNGEHYNAGYGLMRPTHMPAVQKTFNIAAEAFCDATDRERGRSSG